MHRKKRIISLVSLIALLVGSSAWYIFQEHRHEQLNALLIDALWERRYNAALALVHKGADGSARLGPAPYMSLRGRIVRLLESLMRRTSAVATDDRADAIEVLFCKRYDLGDPTTRDYSRFVDYGGLSSEPDDESFQKLVDALTRTYPRSLPDMPASLYEPALRCAIICHHHHVVKLLLTSHPDAARQPVALLSGADLADLIESVKHGADVNEVDYYGRTALFFANAQTVEPLIRYGARVNITASGGETPLTAACKRGDDACVAALIQHGANMGGPMTLMWGAERCRLETMQLMVRSGADVHARDSNGDTLLMFATCSADQRVFDWALHKGIDVNARDVLGHTALTIAQEYLKSAQSGGATINLFTPRVRRLLRLGALPTKTTGLWNGDERFGVETSYPRED